MRVLTFDIGGSMIKSILIEDGKEIYKTKIPSRAKEGAIYLKEDIFQLIRKLLEDNFFDGIAISTAGMVDSDTGIISYANENIKNYIGFDWRKLIKEEFNLDSIVENDVKSAAMGEANYGAGKDFDSIFTLTVGTGIGGSFINDGKIYRGASKNAGEIGYIPFEDSIIEKKASTTAILNLSKEKFPKKNYTDGKKLFEAFDKGEKEAIYLVDILTDNLSKLIATLMLILSPKAILIGGGISNQKDKLLNPIREKTKKLVPQNIYDSTKILNTKLGNKSGCFGAYSIFEKAYNND
ncbi:MAG: ROK family protein [Tissierellia bacterium]|nr:ROK family protein [Tissierellia bacterium]